MGDRRTDPETYAVMVSVESLASAIAAGLTKASGHRADCEKDGCPVGEQMHQLGEMAAPETLAVLLGVAL